jgi:hypothetical protein
MLIRRAKFTFVIAVIAVSAVIVSACQGASAQSVPVQAARLTQAASVPTGASPAPSGTVTSPVKYIGEFSINPAHAPSGAKVSAAGKGFESNTELELIWQGFKGTWKVEGSNFNGRDFTDVMQSLAKVKTDASGSFQTTFTVPSGFGFGHDVLVEKQNEIQNKSNFDVDMQVSMSPSSGPVGTPVNINAQGIGWRSLENSWEVIYDNKFTGWISSVTTGGIAHASIPAVGAPGKHIIQIIHGSATFPYMNMQQSPEPDRPTWTFEFTVTAGAAIQPPSVQAQSLPIEKGTVKPDSTGPAIWTDILSGTVGTAVTLQGSGLPAGKQLDLLWFHEVGSRVSGQGYSEASVSLGKVTVTAEGNIVFPFKTLDDLGGPHRIEVQDGGTKLAETSFTISPSAFALSPSSGPAGTTITIHLKGVGWTQTANIYTLVYDNAYVGYACGFNSQGDATVYLPATGEPGWHYVDLYPGIYLGTDMSQTNDFRIPQLTAQDDHPGERLPVFHFAFLVTN